MKTTFIPLCIAFIAADGRIVNIDDMAPRDETLHWYNGPVRYALEMRKGWFAERAIIPIFDLTTRSSTGRDSRAASP